MASTVTHTLVAVSHAAPAAQSALLTQRSAQAPVVVHRNGRQSVTVPSLAVDESRSAEHVAMINAHTPSRQANPSTQCSAREHEVRHPASSHLYGAHSMAAGVEQSPVPLQVDSPV